jgi:hypothetical protein
MTDSGRSLTLAILAAIGLPFADTVSLASDYGTLDIFPAAISSLPAILIFGPSSAKRRVGLDPHRIYHQRVAFVMAVRIARTACCAGARRVDPDSGLAGTSTSVTGNGSDA